MIAYNYPPEETKMAEGFYTISTVPEPTYYRPVEQVNRKERRKLKAIARRR